MVKAKAKKVEECVTALDIEVPHETVEQALEEVYSDIAKVVTIPGFRQGKAPRDLVKKHHAKDAREELLKRLIPDAYQKAVEEHKVDPLGMPAISDVSYTEGKPFSFKARVTTRPVFALKSYKGVAVDRRSVAVSSDDIEKTIENLRQVHAKYVAADGRPVRMGDFVVADLACEAGGKEVHKKRENVWLAIEKDSFIPGLGEKMVGMQKGEERPITVTLPEKYPDKAVAGKEVLYRVTVKDVKERQMPAVDDEFAKDLGQGSLAALKEAIAKELEARMRASADAEAENALLAKLAADNVFPVPASFVQPQLAHMVDNAKRQLLQKGFQQSELDKKDDEFRKKFKDDAVNQVRLLFILDAIATAEKIEVSESDVNEAYASLAGQSGRSEAEVRDHYEKEGAVDALVDKIREGKTVAFLMKNAVVTEKSS